MHLSQSTKISSLSYIPHRCTLKNCTPEDTIKINPSIDHYTSRAHLKSNPLSPLNMSEDTTTTTTNTSQQLAMPSAQPNSRLHRLPQELKEMIFSFVVISPTPIPARVHLRDDGIVADEQLSSPGRQRDQLGCGFCARCRGRHCAGQRVPVSLLLREG